MIKAGQRLKEERLRQGLTLEDVSKSTRIKTSFLDAIEKSEYDKLPASTFAQGFVRNYTQFLKLPDEEVIPLFRREFDEEKIYNQRLKDSAYNQRLKDSSYNQRLKDSYKVLPPGATTDFPISRIKKSQFILIALLFVVLASYLLFQYKDAIIAPSINITTPSENEVVKTTLVSVEGSTDPENVVYVNDFPVSVDDNGRFKKILYLFPGKTKITIKAVNRFNKVAQVTRDITVEGQ